MRFFLYTVRQKSHFFPDTLSKDKAYKMRTPLATYSKNSDVILDRCCYHTFLSLLLLLQVIIVNLNKRLISQIMPKPSEPSVMARSRDFSSCSYDS